MNVVLHFTNLPFNIIIMLLDLCLAIIKLSLSLLVGAGHLQCGVLPLPAVKAQLLLQGLLFL